MTNRNDGYIALNTDNDGERPIDGVPGPSAFTFPNGGHFNITSQPSYRSTRRRLTYTYSYGPPGLAGLSRKSATSSTALVCALFASLGGLSFGYDQGVIANVLVMKDFVGRWGGPLSEWQVGWLTAMLELGSLIGALAAGIFADRYSRRQSISFACLMFCIGSTFQCAAQTLVEIFVGRFIGGLGIGSLSMLSPLYMAEISPPEVRGTLMALEQFAIVLGVVMGFWIGFFTRDFAGSISWRLPLLIQIIPGIVLGVGCFFLPASPRLLILQGRTEDAWKALRSLRLGRRATSTSYGGDTSDDITELLVKLELVEMEVEAALIRASTSRPTEDDRGKAPESLLKAEINTWRTLLSDKYRERTLIGILMMFFQQWSGINALLYYGPFLLRNLGFTGDTVNLVGSGGIGIMQLIAVLPALIAVDRVGRKPLLQGGGFFMGLSHLTVAVLVWLYQSSWNIHQGAAWLALTCLYTFTLAYGVSFGPIAWILPSEVFPLSVRSKGVAIATASNWVNNFFIGLVTPGFMAISAPATFFIFAFACFLASFWATTRVPETAGVSLEEIDGLFKNRVAEEDESRRVEIENQLGLEDLVRRLSRTVQPEVDSL